MAEIFPQDIELAVITRLKDATYGIQAQLDIIDLARTQSTPEISDASISDERQDENPEVIIDYESSNINSFFGDDDLSNLRKTGNILVSVFLNSADRDNIKKYISNYIEAITKCLHGYSTGNLTALYADEDMITDLYKDERESTKYGGVRFEMLINGGTE